MKKIIVIFLTLVTVFMFGCGSTSDDTKYLIDYDEVGVTYTTEDGEWNDYSVENMLDLYYGRKAEHVNMVVKYTFIAKDSFDQADLVYMTGIGEVNGGLGFTYQKFTGTIEPKIMGGSYPAGTYTIEIQADDVRYFAWKTIFIPYERDDLVSKFRLEIYRYQEA